MNTMAPRFGFNLGDDRFDTQVMAAYKNAKMLRHSRDSLIAQVHAGRWNHMSPARLPGMAAMSVEDCARAAMTVIDYYFEPRVMESMQDTQAHDYFCGFAKTMKVDRIDGVAGGAPIWVETVHHACIFSILYDLILHLARYHGVRRAILIHHGQRPEPRLAIIARLLRSLHKIEPYFVQLKDNWFQSLAKVTTPDTVILYLSDVPTPPGTKDREPAHLLLSAEPGLSACVDTTPGAALLARRLKARHVLLDFPGFDRIRLRPAGQAGQLATLPLPDWVFWPLLKAA